MKSEVEVPGNNPDLQPNPEHKKNFVFLHDIFDEVGFQAARDAFNQKESEIAEQFIQDLFKEEGLPDNEFTRMLFSKCWEAHHSSGRSEVWNCMSDYTEIYEAAEKFFLNSKNGIKI